MSQVAGLSRDLFSEFWRLRVREQGLVTSVTSDEDTVF